MDAPIKVTHHIQLKLLVILLFAGLLFLLLEGFVLRDSPTWSHWGLLIVGTPIFLFILGTTFLSIIEVNEGGIEKRWGLKQWNVSILKIPWTDVEHVTPYREDLHRQHSRKSSARPTGIKFQSNKGKYILMPHLMNGTREAFEYASEKIPSDKIEPSLTKSQ